MERFTSTIFAKAANYTAFKQHPHLGENVLHNNTGTSEGDLKDVVQGEEFKVNDLLIRPSNRGENFSLFGPTHKLSSHAVDKEDNLTHWYYNSMNPIPLAEITIGSREYNQDIDRTYGPPGENNPSERAYSGYTDLSYTKDKLYDQ